MTFGCLPLLDCFHSRYRSPRERTQVGRADVIIIEQLSTLTFADDSAAFEDVGALNQFQYRVHVLFDNEHAHAVAMQFAQDNENRLDDFRRQTESGTLEEEETRRRQQAEAR